MSGHASSSSLVLVGWDFHETPVELRERLAFSPEKVREALAAMQERGLLTEGVIVSTCNRSEIYGMSGQGVGDRSPLDALMDFVTSYHGVPRAEAEPPAYQHSGREAVRHLLRVSAGLESLALGEDQIIGQVREAFRLASTAGATRAVLNRLFQKALEAGKRVRSETRLNSRPISIPGVAIELAQKIYENLADKKFLILGAGETSGIFYDLVLARGARSIEVANRTLSRAEALVQRGGTAHPWEQVAERLPLADIVVTATSTTSPVITYDMAKQAMKQRQGQPLFFLDLGIPRNVAPQVSDLENAFLYAVDDLQEIATRNREARQAEIEPALRILDEEIEKFEAWLGALAVVPTVTALHQRFDLIREMEFDRRIDQQMSHLPEADRDRLRGMAQSMVRCLLRKPTEALKEEANAELRLQRAETVRHLFALDMDKD
jgi:glutamyl-tRNA reductase